MPRIISRYSERPSACQDQPDGQRIVSGHTPKMKIIPTTIKAMRRYLMRSASVMFVLLFKAAARAPGAYRRDKHRIPLARGALPFITSNQCTHRRSEGAQGNLYTWQLLTCVSLRVNKKPFGGLANAGRVGDALFLGRLRRFCKPRFEQREAERQDNRTDEKANDTRGEEPADRTGKNHDHGNLDPAPQQHRLEDIIDQANKDAPNQEDDGGESVRCRKHVDDRSDQHYGGTNL